LKIGFIGSGNMSEAIISGMIVNEFSPENISILDVSKERIEFMINHYKVGSPNVKDFFENSDVLIIAVKPQIIPKVLSDYKNYIKKEHLLISIAAGVSIEKISKLTNLEKIIRVMPNTPALISKSISAITYKSQEVTDKDKKLVEKIIESIGEFVWIEESQMDAVTALSGSGPAYVFRFIEAMIDSAVLVGLSRDLSRKLVVETVLGSTLMLKETGKSPKELENQVTSPGGTTIHGLVSMEKNNFSSSIREGIKAAYLRAVELGLESK